MQYLARFVSTGAFTGYFPFAPGTFGSFVMAGILYVSCVSSPLMLAVITAVLFFGGVFASTQTEKELGKDPSVVVIDEMAGMTCSLLFLPKTLIVWFVAFLIFRFFDIFKPYPIRQLENIKGGWGIMLDDIGAGVVTAVIMNAGIRVFF
ncbi:phosphatidylglycerophosphatase A [bacterium]|nr:phosphatidylglycerophosphatase A [bacterium]